MSSLLNKHVNNGAQKKGETHLQTQHWQCALLQHVWLRFNYKQSSALWCVEIACFDSASDNKQQTSFNLCLSCTWTGVWALRPSGCG